MSVLKGKNKKDGKTDKWFVLESGAMANNSSQFVKQTIMKLKDNREFFNISHKGYLSPKVVLVAYDDERLQIDKPFDWPYSHNTIYIIFKGEEQLLNELEVEVVSVDNDSIYTTFPAGLIQYQRRANYRVRPDRTGKASFWCKGKAYKDLDICDISAEGVMVCVEKKIALSEADLLTDIFLSFSKKDQLSEDHVEIRQGKVVRFFRNDQRRFCYGIQFQLTKKEENILLCSVRKFEHEILRLGT